MRKTTLSSILQPDENCEVQKAKQPSEVTQSRKQQGALWAPPPKPLMKSPSTAKKMMSKHFKNQRNRREPLEYTLEHKGRQKKRDS